MSSHDPDALSLSVPGEPASHEQDPTDPSQVRPVPFFSLIGTIICTVLVAVFLVGLLFLSSTTRIGALDRPEDDLERLVSREMDARQVLQTAPRWEQLLDRFLSGNEDTLTQSIRWYDELTREVDSSEAQLYRVVLLAEAGRADRVSAALVPWQYQGEVMSHMLDWVQAAYLGAPPTVARGERFIGEIREELSPGWFADVLVAHIAAAIGDRTAQAEAESAIRDRGHVLVNRRRVLAAVELFLLLLGALLLLRLMLRHAVRPLGVASVPPPWSVQDGYALFIRGVLGFLAISSLVSYFMPDPTAVNAVITLLAGAPMLWLIVNYARRQGLSMKDMLGLRMPLDTPQLFMVTMVLTAASLAGEMVITAIIAFFHINTDWTDGLLEDLLWGPWWAAASAALDSIVWAPLVEEIAFRGVLYATLRKKMGSAPSAILSAGGFALVHGYGAVGLASVFWSGIIWAIAYERTRSLWPAILAHGVNNLLVSAEFLVLFR